MRPVACRNAPEPTANDYQFCAESARASDKAIDHAVQREERQTARGLAIWRSFRMHCHDESMTGIGILWHRCIIYCGNVWHFGLSSPHFYAGASKLLPSAARRAV